MESLTTPNSVQIPSGHSATVRRIGKISKGVRKNGQEIYGQDNQALGLLDRDAGHYYKGAPPNNRKCGGDGSELSLCNGTDRVNKN